MQEPKRLGVRGRLSQVAAFAYKDLPQPGLSAMPCVQYTCPHPARHRMGEAEKETPPRILNAVGTEAAWHSLCGF